MFEGKLSKLNLYYKTFINCLNSIDKNTSKILFFTLLLHYVTYSIGKILYIFYPSSIAYEYDVLLCELNIIYSLMIFTLGFIRGLKKNEKKVC